LATKKRRVAVKPYHCDALTLAMVVAESDFSFDTFRREFTSAPNLGDASGIAGPLRPPEGGPTQFAFSAGLEFHDHGDDDKHYWIVLRASRIEEPIEAEESEETLPTVDDFLHAVASAALAEELPVHVTGRHRFSTKEWRGMAELPAPLPDPPEGLTAHLTGLQVTYEGPSGREVVLLSVRDDLLTTSTDFELATALDGDLVESALKRSIEIAKRLVNEVVKAKQEA
jgi:hypothetical protein